MDAFAAFRTFAEEPLLVVGQESKSQHGTTLQQTKSLEELIQVEIKHKHIVRENLLKVDLINDRVMMEMQSWLQKLADDTEALGIPNSSHSSLSLESCSNLCKIIKDRIQTLRSEVQILESEAEERIAAERSCSKGREVNVDNVISIRNMTAELLKLQRDAWSLREKKNMLCKLTTVHSKANIFPAKESSCIPKDIFGCTPKSTEKSTLSNTKADSAFDLTI